jgi:hypothetical protein
LGAVYRVVVGQWVRELNHVAAVVGGYNSQQKHGGQDGLLFTPVAREKQKAAVEFLNRNLFTTPSWLIRTDIERRIAPSGALTRVLNAQRSVLMTLLGGARMARLQEQEAIDGTKAYPAIELLADLREEIFSELSTAAPRVDAYRRNLQRAYLELINDRLNSRPVVTGTAPTAGALGAPFNLIDDARGLFRAELRAIAARITAKLASSTDRATRAHMDDMKDRIAQILDPKVLLPAGGTGIAAGARPSWDEPPAEMEEDGCWPDFAVLP